MHFKIHSDGFSDGTEIPRTYSKEDKDHSPPLHWSGIPVGTKELVLICEDPDAPGGTWDHWLLYKIPADLTTLPEHLPSDAVLPALNGAVQGKNSWDELGYGGPLPPKGHGNHRYYFRLFALDIHLDLLPGATKAELLAAIEGHVLGETTLMGKYHRA